jgi:hypothetical protein
MLRTRSRHFGLKEVGFGHRRNPKRATQTKTKDRNNIKIAI